MMKETQKTKFIYKSSYDRGLETLLKMWPLIKKELPDAELKVCYGFDLFLKAYSNNPYMMKWKKDMETLMEQDGITHYGRVSKSKLDELTADSDFWVYPTHFQETNCHPAGTFVETEEGDIEIQKLTLTHKVRTKDGNLKRITAIRSKEVREELYTIKIGSNEDLKVTADHPIYVIKKEKNDNGRSIKEIIKRTPVWVKTSEIEIGDIVLASRKLNVTDFKIDLSSYKGKGKNNLPTENNEINTDFDDAKALWFGYFAGDGTANNRGQIQVLVGKAHYDRDFNNVINGFKSFGLTPDIKEENGYYKVQAYSHVLARFLRTNFYDTYKNKYIPTNLRSNDLVFEGLINSDGSVNYNYNSGKGKQTTFTSISRKLISSFRYMMAKKGFAGKISLRHHIRGKDSYSISWTEYEGRKLNNYGKDDNFIYFKVKDISKEIFNGLVYNIDVEDEHNYHANGIIVHNCITALDSQKLGCVPVTMNLAALQDTVFSGVKIDGDIQEQETKDLFLKELVSLAKDEKRLEEEKKKAIEGAKAYAWSNIASEWAKHFK